MLVKAVRIRRSVVRRRTGQAEVPARLWCKLRCLLRILHHYGHQFAFRLEGDFVDNGVIGITADACLSRRNHQRAFRWIADDLPAIVVLRRRFQLRIVAP